MGLALSIWLDFNKWASTQADHWIKGMGLRATLLVMALAFAFSIAYSRVFLGVHSLNQVYYGL